MNTNAAGISSFSIAASNSKKPTATTTIVLAQSALTNQSSQPEPIEVGRAEPLLSDLDRANQKFKDHDYQEALGFYQKVYLIPDLDTKLKIVECLYHLQQIDEFKTSIQALKKDFPTDPHVLYWDYKQQLMMEQSLHGTQVTAIQSLILTLDPTHPVVPKLHLLILSAAKAIGNPADDSFNAGYLDLLQRYPKDSDVIEAAFVHLCLQPRLYEHFVEFPKQPLPISNREIKFLDEALENDPKNPRLILVKATSLFLLEDYQRSRSLFVTCYNKSPQQFIYYFIKLIDAIVGEDSDIECKTASLFLSPLDFYLVSLTGILLEESEETDELGPYDRLAALNSSALDNPYVFSTLATWCTSLHRNNIKANLDIYLKLIQLEPHASPYYYIHAAVECIKEDRIEAAKRWLITLIDRLTEPASFLKFTQHRHFQLDGSPTVEDWKKSILFEAYAYLAEIAKDEKDESSLVYLERAFEQLPFDSGCDALDALILNSTVDYLKNLLMKKDEKKAIEVLQRIQQFGAPFNDKMQSFNICFSYLIKNHVTDALEAISAQECFRTRSLMDLRGTKKRPPVLDKEAVQLKKAHLDAKLGVIESLFHEQHSSFEKEVLLLGREYPNDPNVGYWLCQLFLQRKAYTKALQSAENLLQRGFDPPKIKLLIAQCRTEMGGTASDQLVATYLNLLETYPEDSEVVAGVFLFLTTRPILFEHFFGKPKVDLAVTEDQMKHLDQVLDKNRQNPRLMLAKAMCLFHSENYKGALKLIEKVLFQTRSHSLAIAIRKIMTVMMGKKSIDEDPEVNHPLVAYLLGIFRHLTLKNFDNSLSKVDREGILVAGNRDFTHAAQSTSVELEFSALCAKYELAQRHSQSTDAIDYDRLIALEPHSSVDYYLNRAMILKKSEKISQAIDILKLLIDRLNDPESYLKFVNHRHSQFGKGEEAEMMKRSALFEAHALFYKLYHSERDKSLENLERAFEQFPIDSFLISDREREIIDLTIEFLIALIKRNDRKKAIEFLEKIDQLGAPFHLPRYARNGNSFRSCLTQLKNEEDQKALETLEAMQQPIHKKTANNKGKETAAPVADDTRDLEERKRLKEERKEAAIQRKLKEAAEKAAREKDRNLSSSHAFVPEPTKKEKKERPQPKGPPKSALEALRIKDEIERRRILKAAAQTEAAPLVPPPAPPVGQPPAPEPVAVSAIRPARPRLQGPIAQTIDLRSNDYVELKPERTETPLLSRTKKQVEAMSEALSTRLKSAKHYLTLLGGLYNGPEPKESLKYRRAAEYFIFKFCESLCDTSNASFHANKYSETLKEALVSKSRIRMIDENARKMNLHLMQIHQELAISSEGKENASLASAIHQYLKINTLKPMQYHKLCEELRKILRMIPHGDKQIDPKITEALEVIPLKLTFKELAVINERLVDLDTLDLIRTDIRSYFQFVSPLNLNRLIEALYASSLLENIQTWIDADQVASFQPKVRELPYLCSPEKKEAWNRTVALQNHDEANTELFKLMHQNFQEIQEMIDSKRTFNEYWKVEMVRAACKMCLSNIRKCLVTFRDFGLLHRFKTENEETRVTYQELIDIGNRIGHHIENGEVYGPEDILPSKSYEIAKQSTAIWKTFAEVQRGKFSETLPVILHFTRTDIDQLRSHLEQAQVKKTHFLNLNLLGNITKRCPILGQFQQNTITKQMALSMLEGYKKEVQKLSPPIQQLMSPSFNDIGEDSEKLFALIANAHQLLKLLFE